MFVCLGVTKNEHFRAERRRRHVRCPLGLAGRGRLWPSDDDDDDGDDDDDDGAEVR